MNFSRYLASVVVLSAALANAQAQPRVMVILDTSKSMEEPTNATFPPVLISAPGGDWDANTNPTCLNKFCTAKKVIHTVIPKYTTDAKIGLTTYYQYILNMSKPDNQTTQCIYDVLAAPGLVRRFQSDIDLTGSGTTVCPAGAAAACGTDARGVNFPDGWQAPGSDARLDDVCNNPVGYSRPPVLPNSSAPACPVGNPRCYTLTKTVANPLGTTICAINSNPTPLVPGSPLPSVLTTPRDYATAPTAPGCATGRYTVLANKENLPMAGNHQKYVSLGTVTCAGTVFGGGPSVMPVSTSPAGLTNPTENPNAITVGTGIGQWSNVAGLFCSAAAPCAMYLESPTPVTVASDRAWYGFFDNTFAPNGTTLGGNTPDYALSTSPGFPGGSVGYTADFFRMNVGSMTRPTTTGQVACQVSGRKTSGALSNYGVTNALGQLNANMSLALSGRLNEAPTRAVNDFTCSAAWPCDVTLTNDTLVSGTWVPDGVVYNTTGLPNATRRFTAGGTAASVLSTPSFTLRLNNAVTRPSCPVIGTTTTNPTFSDTSWTAAPGGCGAGNAECTFSAPTAGTPVATTCSNRTSYPTGTTALISKFNNAAVANCDGNNKAYSAPVTFANDGMGQPYRVIVNVPDTATCAAGPLSVSDVNTGAVIFGGYPITSTNIPAGLVSGGNPASLTFVGQPAAGNNQSGFGYRRGNPPFPYTGAPFLAEDYGTPTNLGPPAPNSESNSSVSANCPAAVGTEVQNVADATLCAGNAPCTLRVLGVTTVSNTCGQENNPCYRCQYQPMRFRWQQAAKNCTYSATRYDYTANRERATCVYTRNQWSVERLTPDTHTCEYSIGARRYDFSQPSQKYCRYFSVRSTLESPRMRYTYEYLTKGTEPVGRATTSVQAGNLCTQAYGGAFETACPETKACTTLNLETMAIGALDASNTCRLKWGGPNSAGSNDFRTFASRNARNNGRFAGYKGIDVSFTNPALPAHKACESDPPAVLPDTYKSDTGTPRGFCAASGTPPSYASKLVTDYYDPSAPPQTENATYPWLVGAGWTLSWNKSATKAQGFGGQQGAPGPAGELPLRSLFVPVPNDGDSPAAQEDAIKNAVRKCVMPSVGPPGGPPAGSLDGGACISDERIPTSPPVNGADNGATPTLPTSVTGDFTPLYGSLRNTYDYLNARWATDGVDEKQCRDYFIVLATDGLENTPKGYTVGGADPATSVQGLVQSFRHITFGAPKTRPDVKTFIIALGTGAAGSPLLDDVAQSGGTTQAFSATNLAQLETALESVFTAITQGVFSRSRPAIGTDGQRIYAAQFIRPMSGPPDWSGMLSAYRIDPNDGTFSLAWEHSNKLNNAAHPARDIVIALREDGDYNGNKMVVNFDVSASSELDDQLDEHPDFPGGMTTDEVITFLRTSGESYFGAPGTRASKLGPIENSAPVVVGKSPYDAEYGGKTQAQRDEFALFRKTTDTNNPDGGAPPRSTRVLVAANDGMLHAITEGSKAVPCTSLGEADPTCPSGQEDWAFIPGSLRGEYRSGYQNVSVVDQLFRLKKGAWTMRLLDNTVSVADVCGDGSGEADNCTANQWKTIAIMSQRQGGRSIMALDITNTSATPNTSKFLWDFFDDDLGFTYSIPAITRVEEDNDEKFVAIFGAGMDDPNSQDWSGNSCPGSQCEGPSIFVVNALNGQLIKHFKKFDKGPVELDMGNPVVARPAVHRRPGPNVSFGSSAFVSAGDTMFAMRFAKPNGDMEDNEDKWKPDELFDPTENRNTEYPSGGVVKVKSVVELTPGNAAAIPPEPPTYGLSPVQDLPLATAPPILIRPKLGSIVVPNGTKTDLFYGTGDIRTPATPSSDFKNGNYFYAIHDKNEQLKGSNNDGRAMWIVKFPVIDPLGTPRYEQVVSEPAIISGCIVVATYTTPLTAGSCNQDGDTTLYGFRPIDGELQPCLTFLGGPFNGASTSVIKMPGAGIPSDLIVINDNVYLSTSKDGLKRAPVRIPPRPGAVRSYRRIK